MPRYARETRVPVDRSKSEVERTLTRYGADQFAYGNDAATRQAVIGFRFKTDAGHRTVKFTVPMPDPAAFTKTSRGRRRGSGAAAQADYEKAVRQRWRAVALIVKAKLEAVEAGISTLEREWLAYLLLPGGETVGERCLPEVATAYQTGKPPPLLLGCSE